MSAAAVKKYSHVLELILLYSPVLVAVLVMLPRLLSPQFGLFDDGKSIITAQDIVKGDWGFRFDVTDARFRPLYWLSFAFLYYLVGEQPVWFFLLNTLVLCLTVAALIAFLRKQGANPWQVWLAGLLFVVSGATVENFFTLSKGEWLQVMFIASSLFVVTVYSPASVLWYKVLVVSSASLLLLCGTLSKETSVVILPVSATWVAFGWLWARRTSISLLTWRIPYLISSAVAVSVYFLSRFIFISSAASTSGYTERYHFTVSQFVSSAIRWSGWLVRDHSYVFVMMLLLIILLISRRSFSQMQLAVDMFVWMAVWIVVYLPWNFMTEYYMLPFAFGAAIFAGLVLGENVVWRTPVTKILAALSVLLIAVSIINNVTTARIQLAVDNSNARLMSALAALPAGSGVYLNIQSANEYTDQIKMQLTTRFGREDIVVDLFQPGMGGDKACPKNACYVVSPWVHNQPLLTVRMGVHEPTQVEWNKTLQDYMGESAGWSEVQSISRSFPMLAVDFPRLFCALIETRAFCSTPSPFIDTRSFQYGWTIYEMERP